jgi:Helix-turn-helix domain
MRSYCMQQVAFALPALPGIERPKTYAAYPVWSDSTTKEIKFQPMPKKAAVKLWHRARDFDRQTRRKDHHGGAVGHIALQVLHALIFDFMNYRSGRLDPSYATIARAANVCERTVANALKRLKDLGILNWVRRCAESWMDGRFVLEQETNAYAVLPASQWRGYREPPEPPPPASGTWGDHPPLPCVMTQAVDEQRHGGGLRSVLGILDSDPTDRLAAALASLGRRVQMRNPQ